MKSKDQRIFLESLYELEREKGINKDELLEAIETAILAAYKKNYKDRENAEVEINKSTGEIKIFSKKMVVESVEDPDIEISLEDAMQIKKRIKLGDIATVDIHAEDFKRNAIQNAKQIVIQKVRECEKQNIFKGFKSLENNVATGLVKKTDEKGNLYIEINTLEAIIPKKELLDTDHFAQGDRIKVYVGSVEEGTKFTKIYISRKSEEFLKKLFEFEIPEVESGTIEIKSVAREPGNRTKIALYSADENLDVKGACIGKGGMRIQNIIDELGGEKIDIVLWDEDIRYFVKNALNPADVISVEILEINGEEVARAEVSDDQLSLAIGKKGQNSRLAAKLCSVKIDIYVSEVVDDI